MHLMNGQSVLIIYDYSGELGMHVQNEESFKPKPVELWFRMAVHTLLILTTNTWNGDR